MRAAPKQMRTSAKPRSDAATIQVHQDALMAIDCQVPNSGHPARRSFLESLEDEIAIEVLLATSSQSPDLGREKHGRERQNGRRNDKTNDHPIYNPL